VWRGLTGKRVATMGGFPPLGAICEYENDEEKCVAVGLALPCDGHGITLSRIASRKLESLCVARPW
jgi:hypothetical protein